jgi:hypothetical protein
MSTMEHHYIAQLYYYYFIPSAFLLEMMALYIVLLSFAISSSEITHSLLSHS